MKTPYLPFLFEMVKLNIKTTFSLSRIMLLLT